MFSRVAQQRLARLIHEPFASFAEIQNRLLRYALADVHVRFQAVHAHVRRVRTDQLRAEAAYLEGAESG